MKKTQRAGGILMLLTMLFVLAACSKHVTGTYVSSNEPSMRLELKGDGSFSLYTKNDVKPVATGNYKVEGSTITFAVNGSSKTGAGKINGDTLTDPDGKTWKKE